MTDTTRRNLVLAALATPFVAILPGLTDGSLASAVAKTTLFPTASKPGRGLSMIVELRTYFCVPGRMPALHERFKTTALGFFEKYGIKPIGFWTNLTGETNQSLTYMLKWESLADRETRWNAFQADKEWIAKHAASEADGIIIERIENHFMVPTDYSVLR